MLRCKFFGPLFAASVLLSGLPAAHGQAFVGKDSDENRFTAKLEASKLIVMKEEGDCSREYYLKVGTVFSNKPWDPQTPRSARPGQQLVLTSCEMLRCLNPKLKEKKCNVEIKDPVKWDCNGSLDYRPDGQIRLEIHYLDEDWKVPACRHAKFNQASKVIILRPPPSAQGSQPGDATDCAVRSFLYQGEGHPLGQCR